jgi:hypothetical protein
MVQLLVPSIRMCTTFLADLRALSGNAGAIASPHRLQRPPCYTMELHHEIATIVELPV